MFALCDFSQRAFFFISLRMKPICEACNSVKSISRCVNSIEIGTSTSNINISVFFENTFGRINVFSTDTNTSNVIIIDVSLFNFNTSTSYNIWCIDTDSSEVLDLEIKGFVEPVKCVSLSFDSKYDINNNLISEGKIILEAC